MDAPNEGRAQQPMRVRAKCWTLVCLLNLHRNPLSNGEEVKRTEPLQLSNIRLETERLILRPTRPEDFEGWVTLMGNPESARFIGGVQPRAHAWRTFVTMAGVWAMQGFGMFSVLEKSSGRWIGRIGPWQPEGWPGTEIAWSLIRDAWGHGYASEAASAAADWAFAELGWSEMIHVIDPSNLASQKLAQRLGSTLRGPGQLPPPLQDFPIEIWGQSRDAWEHRRA